MCERTASGQPDVTHAPRQGGMRDADPKPALKFSSSATSLCDLLTKQADVNDVSVGKNTHLLGFKCIVNTALFAAAQFRQFPKAFCVDRV